MTPDDPITVWLDYLKPFSTGLVVAPNVLRDLGLVAPPQRATDTADASAVIVEDSEKPALPDAWAFFAEVLGWPSRHVAGSPSGPDVPESLHVRLPEYGTTLAPTWAVRDTNVRDREAYQLLVCRLEPGIDPDGRGALAGWEATPHQRLERLLRETEVPAGLLISDTLIRLVYAPKGETSGWLGFPIRSLATIQGRPMLGGLKLVLDDSALFTNDDARRLPGLLKASRDAQANVSTELAAQVLGALHDLLRGFDAADPEMVRGLVRDRPEHLYEGLLTVLMRLVFVLYAEDRDLLPSRTDPVAHELYEQSYSMRGLYHRLLEDAALNPDTMDERRGGWGRMLALFRMVHGGHASGFVRPKRGKLFDPDAFLFLEGRSNVVDRARVLPISDGSVLRILEGLMTLQARGGARERISYRALDVEQIGSVYETVMGFTAVPASGPVLAIKGGKNNRTPIYLDLAELAALKGDARLKVLKEAGRSTLSARLAKAIKDAKAVADLAAALDSIVDERGSPKRAVQPPATPLLQPTDERRRTGSHYTPRSLTEPIVRHALEPVFDRIGAGATPEAVLDLKICDPAMGSGAFLVEACRQIGARLVRAWGDHDATPVLPPDEDVDLHARRLVAQHCVYGVDRNPRAVDLAKLSLWLATLAADHEFTFLDHALREGDSLVGLNMAQIAALHWDESKPPTLIAKPVSDYLREAYVGRVALRTQSEGASETDLRPLLQRVEAKLALARLIGDGVIAAHFASDKPKPRIEGLVAFQKAVLDHLGSARWESQLAPFSAGLAKGTRPLKPFHWPVEFTEVFSRPNPGFDAIVGNPPFAGKNTTIAGNREGYLLWLQTLHAGAHGNADLIAHFFRHAFSLLRDGGVFGLIATNTIGQGDTRDTGLATILSSGGAIARATRRLKWPGEAAVVVSVVHVIKGKIGSSTLNEKLVRRVSAFLVDGDLDNSPARLAANTRKAFVGSYVLGMGFTFDDAAASKGDAESINSMQTLIDRNPKNAERIFPYIGGDEINSSPTHAHHRYVIDFEAYPRLRDPQLGSWFLMNEQQKRKSQESFIVPDDYPASTASDWPDLLEIIERRVKPDRLKQGSIVNPDRWWMFARPATKMKPAIEMLDFVFALSRVSPHLSIAVVKSKQIFSEQVIVLASDEFDVFACMQSSVHEVWTRFFASTLEDRLRYTPSDCFETFPFPASTEGQLELEAAGRAYHHHRAALMVSREEGLTKTYNRFHDVSDRSGDIERLRALHSEMDRLVLLAYGWDDLAENAEPKWLDEENEPEHTYQNRLFWPSSFRDEVLGRLLALNVKRAATEIRELQSDFAKPKLHSIAEGGLFEDAIG
ncbi:Eco57I restriction-modification methylase domain-containing protein [Methylorubrum aminovorans]|uniref:Eco57I restriction-modification methylase domain-containing protein n=1 Tax=Methylorubrum aminovorans TaxID=269069 RepID=UPI003C30129B